MRKSFGSFSLEIEKTHGCIYCNVISPKGNEFNFRYDKVNSLVSSFDLDYEDPLNSLSDLQRDVESEFVKKLYPKLQVPLVISGSDPFSKIENLASFYESAANSIEDARTLISGFEDVCSDCEKLNVNGFVTFSEATFKDCSGNTIKENLIDDPTKEDQFQNMINSDYFYDFLMIVSWVYYEFLKEI